MSIVATVKKRTNQMLQSMHMFRTTSSEQCSLLAAQLYTTQAAFQVWQPKSGSYLSIVFLMMDILVPETY
jgi:hypothetical protein